MSASQLLPCRPCRQGALPALSRLGGATWRSWPGQGGAVGGGRRRRGRAVVAAGAGRNEEGGAGKAAAGKGFGAPSLQTEAVPAKARAGPKGDGAEKARERERGGALSPAESAFEERLTAIKRSAEEKKAAGEARLYNAIDYDNPEPDTSGAASFLTKNLGSKIGIGVAATVFAAIFAFGDILPPISPRPAPAPDSSSTGAVSAQLVSLPPEQRQSYEAQLKAFESSLESSPEDPAALEGAAVLNVELGDLPAADGLLTRLEKVSPEDVEVLRLHAEVQFALGKYGASTASYRRALERAPDSGSVELLQGLAESLIAESKPQEAVNEILEVRKTVDSLAEEPQPSQLGPVQVELLLGKAYLAWGKPGDAAAVYDSLIGARPKDFRGYLAKALLLQSQGKEGDAKRMFLQAKFLAPDAAKGLVDKLAKTQ